MGVHGFQRTATGRIVLRVDVVEKGLLGSLVEQLIEFVTLVGQYDALAMTLNTLGVRMDYPD